MITNFKDVQIFPGIIDLLEGLREKGLLLAIVTSKNKSEFVDEVTPFGLNSYFQAVITASDTLKHKPNPEPVLKGLDELQVLAEQAIYVGDVVYDLRSGKASGTKFALATWGQNFIRNLSKLIINYNTHKIFYRLLQKKILVIKPY